MRKVLMIALLMYSSVMLAQSSSVISSQNLATLKQYEDTLQNLFVKLDMRDEKVKQVGDSVTALSDIDKYKFLMERMKNPDKSYAEAKEKKRKEDEERLKVSQEFIKKFVQALKTPQSYYYSFDSLQKKGLSIVTPKDNKFRIFTWVVDKSDFSYKYYGAIQMNNSDKLKLIGLTDMSSEVGTAEYKQLDNKNWYGALYYNAVKKETDSVTYYTLFGWDGSNDRSTRKIADVLYFDKDGKVKFGAPIFEVQLESGVKSIQHRFMLDFKKGATVTLNYNKDKDIIVYDFLEAEDDEASRAAAQSFALVPDGTYQGFEFKEGLWKHVPKVFFETLTTAPRPAPKFDSGTKKKRKKKRKKRR